uniref:Squalene cyclase N-terminal domain-containing protein n=1 Tax=Oryza meridionalis TaxID=40149 RepID=A0A0E0DNL4_9ORYZ
MFGSCLNYVTLRLLGEERSNDALTKGHAWILSHGSAAAIPQWGKIWLSLCTKGIKVTVVCPGPIEAPQSSGATSSSQKPSSEKRVPVERCAELTIVAATHGLKEAWISYQPVLGVMYLVQYMPTVGLWLMDKVGAKRLDVAAKKGNAYGWNLLFGGKKSA